ncbi:hypothetical protein TNCT_243741 [Trichonephila clavata]|uniref:RNA-directed DNA polymerase n=1 Tax=Trichonephila clavata TaxID=2740835 RepID=A0A8X6GSE5_TRICU|nr:hypothetical protein TNCT_243741 [Trichonephila clavata]
MCVWRARNFIFRTLVTKNGTKPFFLPDKVDPILNYPQPKTIKKLRRFLGLLNFFRRFLPRAAHNQTHLNDFLKGSKRNDKRKINWSEQAKSEFQNCKALLANATLLVHPNPNANLVLQVDASEFAIGGALFQTEGEHLQPLAFFSRKLSETEKGYSAYDRELLAAYASIKQFRYMLKARNFILCTDHKPLTYAFKQKLDKCSPRQVRQLDFISQFTTDIRHIKGSDNLTADTLSRIASIHMPDTIDYNEIAKAQENDSELISLINNPQGLEIKKVNMPNSNALLYCDVSTKSIRPFIPIQYRKPKQSIEELYVLQRSMGSETLRGECAVHATLACAGNLAECGNPLAL